LDTSKLYLLLALSAVTCAIEIPFVRRLALAFNIVDFPSERRVNKRPIARMGGIAIFLTFLSILAFSWFFFGSKLPSVLHDNPRGMLGFALGGCVVFLTGVVDDIRSVTPRTKLLCELLAALVVVYYGGCRVPALSLPGGRAIELGFFEAPIAVLWIVAVTNAVNLMDGLDGLAAGVSALALVSIWAVAGSNHGSIAIISAILIGASIGFLAFNFHPASIFMGDSGSLFLGFSVGVLSTYAGAKASTGAITFVPVLIVALPLADTVFAMIRRYASGLVPTSMRSHVAGVARMFVPDRMHIHHRLLRSGLGQRQAVYVLYGIQAVGCAVAIYVVVVHGGEASMPGAGEPAAMVISSSTPIR
jgi:UDP-GlcNAc:undecaprenyl-phosphate GlcNAc-1-phosphate transferase